ncbi:MAG TPA: TonB-dependent receptor plug domain-containing protein, partial [Allosphingosinicella sp.]
MLRRNTLKTVLFSGAAFAAMAIAGPAAAQTDPAGDLPAAETGAAQAEGTDTAGTEERQDIVVTGTRVVRDGFQAPTPLQVLTEEDIENSSPTNNLADFVNQMPALAASTRPSNSRLELSNGQAGINALNLRSLGTVRTLVLVNGRRSVGSTANGVVDI